MIVLLVGYDLNEMDLKGGSGTYGNSSQANKALMGNPLAVPGLGGMDLKSYGATQPVNKVRRARRHYSDKTDPMENI